MVTFIFLTLFLSQVEQKLVEGEIRFEVSNFLYHLSFIFNFRVNFSDAFQKHGLRIV